MMPYTELTHGVWYPRGGMVRIVESLMELAHQAGVEFVFNSVVERIDIDIAHARGVTLAGGSTVEADIVLANADLPYVYQHLLPPDNMNRKLLHKHFSCSVVSFFWGVDKSYPELGPHTLFLAEDYQANFESINRNLSLPDNPACTSMPRAHRSIHGTSRARYPHCHCPGRASM